MNVNLHCVHNSSNKQYQYQNLHLESSIPTQLGSQEPPFETDPRTHLHDVPSTTDIDTEATLPLSPEVVDLTESRPPTESQDAAPSRTSPVTASSPTAKSTPVLQMDASVRKACSLLAGAFHQLPAHTTPTAVYRAPTKTFEASLGESEPSLSTMDTTTDTPPGASSSHSPSSSLFQDAQHPFSFTDDEGSTPSTPRAPSLGIQTDFAMDALQQVPLSSLTPEICERSPGFHP